MIQTGFPWGSARGERALRLVEKRRFQAMLGFLLSSPHPNLGKLEPRGTRAKESVQPRAVDLGPQK